MSDDTKQRIVDAAIATLKQEGITGTSARAIARTGGFNQALIFYHFGGVHEVLLAGIDQMSAERMKRYGERLGDVRTLPELVEVATQLHREDVQEGHLTVLAQMLAGAWGLPDRGHQLVSRFDPWIDTVERAIARVIEGTPYQELVPTRDLAFAVTSLFIGIELLTHLDPERQDGDRLFSTIGLMAGLLGNLLEQGQPPSG